MSISNNWVSLEDTSHLKRQALKEKAAFDEKNKGKKQVIKKHPDAVRCVIVTYE